MQKYLADILSVLALTMSAEGERVCLIILGCLFNMFSLLIGLVSVHDLLVHFNSGLPFLLYSKGLYLLYVHLFQESLKFRLLGSDGDIGSWGHEYVRLESSNF